MGREAYLNNTLFQHSLGCVMQIGKLDGDLLINWAQELFSFDNLLFDGCSLFWRLSIG